MGWAQAKTRFSSCLLSSPARLPAGDSDLSIFLHHPGPARHLRQLAVPRRPQCPVSVGSCPPQGPCPCCPSGSGSRPEPCCFLEKAAGPSSAWQHGSPGAQPAPARRRPRQGSLHVPAAGSLAAGLASTVLVGAQGSPCAQHKQVLGAPRVPQHGTEGAPAIPTGLGRAFRC